MDFSGLNALAQTLERFPPQHIWNFFGLNKINFYRKIDDLSRPPIATFYSLHLKPIPEWPSITPSPLLVRLRDSAQ